MSLFPIDLFSINLFPINLFPASSLASSVITTVWIGLLVVIFLNRRFGFVLSGLVVPGYLVPLMVIKPVSAAIIIFEGLVVYFLVRAFNRFGVQTGGWCSVFGRDRFFLIILVSVIVRVLFDAGVLPMLADFFISQGFNFDFRYHFQSFGLIVIALIANQLWKPGLRLGLMQLMVSLLLTYVIIMYPLSELTNFTLSYIGYLYEDIAASVYASPKAYIIILTVAFIASRFNLKYGWDFHGILMPSLLALQWHQPEKLLLTFLEAYLLVLLGRWLLQHRWFARWQLEGPRLLLFFFNLSFIYKLLLGHALEAYFPEVKTTDYFAFGYLLSTLLAIKMYEKRIVIRMTRATVQTSLIGVVIASCIGYILYLSPLSSQSAVANPAEEEALFSKITATQQGQSESLEKALGAYRSTLHTLESDILVANTGGPAFRQVLKGWRFKRLSDSDLESQLLPLGFTTTEFEDDIFISEIPRYQHRGAYVLSRVNTNGPVIEVPDVLSQPGLIEAGLWLYRELNASALALGSRSRSRERDSHFQSFHEAVSNHNVLQIRSQPRRSDSDAPSSLSINQRLPQGLDSNGLQRLLPNLAVQWHLDVANIQSEHTEAGFAVLSLSRAGVRSILARSLLSQGRLQYLQGYERIDGYLQSWLLNNKAYIADKWSEKVVAPQVNELIFAEQELLIPLLDWLESQRHSASSSEEPLAEAQAEKLRELAAMASLIDYRLLHYRHIDSSKEYLILTESQQQPSRYWGTYIFRLGQASPFVIEIPRPMYEINTFEYGAQLFERLDAQVLMVAGSHPDANQSGISDVLDVDNKASLFNLIHQSVVKRLAPVPVVQVRAFADNAQIAADMLISVWQQDALERAPTPYLDRLKRVFDSDGSRYIQVNGQRYLSSYAMGKNAQTVFSSFAPQGHLLSLWLSPNMRQGYRQQDENTRLLAQLNALDMKGSEVQLEKHLRSQPFISWTNGQSLRAMLNDYVETGNIQNLYHAYQQNPDISWSHILDINTRQRFLLLSRGERWLGVLNLRPRQQAPDINYQNAQDIQRFLDSRGRWLYRESSSWD
tara:strand:+ start:18 stop:3188 length:3171 start_codon:yes stop_codon:yes gene_type:complete